MHNLETLLGRVHQGERLPANVISPHPEWITLAAYLDATLSLPERQAVEKHLVECSDCLDELVSLRDRLNAVSDATQPLPGYLLQRAFQLARSKPETTSLTELRRVVDLVVRLVRDSVELVTTSGQLILAPVPVGVRGEREAEESGIVHITDTIGEMAVEVEVERVKPGICQIAVAVNRKDAQPAEAIRITLVSAGREQASYLTRKGRAVFENIGEGEYDLLVLEAGAPLGAIRVRIDSDQ